MEFRFPNFTSLRNFRKLIFRIATSDESHFGRKTTILRDLQRWADFSPIPPATITRGPAFSNFTALRNFFGILIYRIATSDEPHFGQERRFFVGASGGRISALFSHTTITMEFRFPNFTSLRNFLKTNFPNHHFR